MAANSSLSAIRLSANLGFLWSDLTLLDRIAAAGRAGFRGVEFHLPYATPASALKAACAAADVAVIGINMPYGDRAGEFGVGALPGREADFLRLFETAATYADAVGASAIHVLAGMVPAAERAAATATFVRNLERASRIAPDGVTLLLEAMNRQERPDYLLLTTAEADAVRAATGAANVKLMFDAYHVGRDGRDAAAEFARYLPQIGHVQIAAVPSRAEPDEGTLDYGALFRTIAASGYRGWVGAEYEPRAATDAGLGWRTTLGV
ncbi:MAG: TIM barrel protein [Bauldia sp.]